MIGLLMGTDIVMVDIVMVDITITTSIIVGVVHEVARMTIKGDCFVILYSLGLTALFSVCVFAGTVDRCCRAKHGWPGNVHAWSARMVWDFGHMGNF